MYGTCSTFVQKFCSSIVNFECIIKYEFVCFAEGLCGCFAGNPIHLSIKAPPVQKRDCHCLVLYTEYNVTYMYMYVSFSGIANRTKSKLGSDLLRYMCMYDHTHLLTSLS